jgi:peptidoglycan/xylan/chitin deacetylase (PgdA/CDA1 family)
MHFLMTVDVESFSIPLNRCDRGMAEEVAKLGLPRLLDLFSKYDVSSTFYFTGEFTSLFPDAIDLVQDNGHEIGCHGYFHDPERSFDILSYDEQVKDLQRAKDLIESVAGSIESFRAPALRINTDTVRALEATKFRSDSSICPQRFDGPFTFGSKKKLKWLIAPRKPYMISYDSIVKHGASNILEIPISAAIVPFIGTTMRVSPVLTKLVRKYLYFESKRTNKPIVFLFHPNECVNVGKIVLATRRTKNPIEYLFGDIIRQKLKLKNLGLASLKLLDEVLSSAAGCGFEFICAHEYTKMYKANWRK